ncbi:TerB family tellurite resistance protein [Desulfotalea psychrophila]|uniref:Related to heat shock protein DnaJ n=1 Tax=Desulfotalea psychrophila (strain LSv54 / DSM 12343) TaxID=177439 RepID=Q6AJ14_DESPS|nr:TerB family tellurite resistance protein [Desulfotalea psychrophila]CAG37666.1 related to heat shock protein DnaJ [Desulfotalea psychrophila LSv54]
MKYQQQQQPGCGGCFIILLLLMLIPGGASFLGSIFSFALTTIVLIVAILWGFSFWMRRKIVDYEQSQTESHNRFVWLLTHILVHIAKIDGVLTKEEVLTIQRFFQDSLRYNQTQMRWVKELIKEASSSNNSLESLLQEFKTSFAYEPRLILLELVYQVMYSNSHVPDNELQIARNIAKYLDISDYDQRTMEAKYRYQSQHPTGGGGGNQEAQFRTVLGVDAGAEFETIRKAYRKLSMQYHPDKVAHLGEEFKKVAEEKMKEINAAYDYFKKRQ